MAWILRAVGRVTRCVIGTEGADDNPSRSVPPPELKQTPAIHQHGPKRSARRLSLGLLVESGSMLRHISYLLYILSIPSRHNGEPEAPPYPFSATYGPGYWKYSDTSSGR